MEIVYGKMIWQYIVSINLYLDTWIKKSQIPPILFHTIVTFEYNCQALVPKILGSVQTKSQQDQKLH